MSISTCTFVLIAAWFSGPSAPQSSQPQAKPAASQPAPVASQPAGSQMPRDAEYLKELIRETERQPLAPPKGAAPTTPNSTSVNAETTRGNAATLRAGGEPAFVDGTMIVERAGKLSRAGDDVEFSFARDDGKGVLRLTLLPCQLLEQVERDMTQAVNQATLTGEITQYKNRSFLLIRTYRRQVDRGNLSP